MNYHLNRNGQNLGVFPLEDLRRRRATGELKGGDMVWCPGMPIWQTLDSVLGLAVPSPKQGNGLVVACVIAVVVFVAACLYLGFKAAPKVIKKETVRLLSETTQFPSDPVQSAGMEAATKPVKPGSKTKTRKDVQKHAAEFRTRQWLEGYKLRGEHKDSYDAMAVGFLSNWIGTNFRGKIDTNLPPVPEMGDKLAANPECNDPLLLTVAALESEEMFEANHRLERALQSFEKSKHKAYPKFYAHIMLAKKLTKDRDYRVPVLDAAALQLFRECFKDGSFIPGDQCEIAEILIRAGGEAFFERNAAAVCEVVETQGDAFKWLSLVLKGEASINEAWAARGSGFSDSVSRSGWEGFGKNLTKAEKYLTEAWRMSPDQPMAPTQMIYVSLGQGGIEKMRLWFDRAIEAQIDYPSAWSQMRWGLRPRWFGDLKSMLAFGITAVNTKRFDTEVPVELFKAVLDIESELQLKGGKHIFGRDDIWPHLQEMYEGSIADPALEDPLGWRSSYAVVSYLAGHYDISAKQLETIHWQPRAAKLASWGLDLSLMTLEVAARTGKHRAEIKQAEDYRQRGKSADATRVYTDLNDAKDLDDRTRAFVRDRLATLTLEKQFQAGDWISFVPAGTNLVGWNLARGKCQSVSADGLEIESGPGGHILYSRARLGINFEAKGSFEVIKTSNKSFQGGLVMGLPQFESQGWNGFRIKRNADEGELSTFSQHWTSKQVASPVSLSNSNSFYLRCRRGKISASVNGKEIFKEVTPPDNYHLTTDEFFIGLGAFNDMNTTTIRYRDVQIKKL